MLTRTARATTGTGTGNCYCTATGYWLYHWKRNDSYPPKTWQWQEKVVEKTKRRLQRENQLAWSYRILCFLNKIFQTQPMIFSGSEDLNPWSTCIALRFPSGQSSHVLFLGKGSLVRRHQSHLRLAIRRWLWLQPILLFKNLRLWYT